MPPLYYDMKSKFEHQHTVATLATGIGGSIYELTCITDLSIRENQNTQQQSKTTWASLPPDLKNITYSTYL